MDGKTPPVFICAPGTSKDIVINSIEMTANVFDVDVEKKVNNNNRKLGKAKSAESHRKSLNDLPLLVIEFILGRFTYQEVVQFRLISRYWNEVVQQYLRKSDENFLRNLTNFRVQWVPVKEQVEDYTQSSHESPNMSLTKKSRSVPRMSRRYRHSSCYVDGSMYIFGGFTSMWTSYNDLWRFDCVTKRWNRIIAEGILPLPRSFFSLNVYETCDEMTGERRPYIVLFGGILSDLSLPLKERVLPTIHMFSIKDNRWILVDIKSEIKLKAGAHSAIVLGDELIVANGLRLIGEEEMPHCHILSFNLKTHCWTIQKSTHLSPTLGRFKAAKYLKSFQEIRSQLPAAFKLNNHNILYLSSPCVIFEEAFMLRRRECNIKGCELCHEQRVVDEVRKENEKTKLSKSMEDDHQQQQQQPPLMWEWIKCTFTSYDTNDTSSLGELCQIGNLIVFMTVKRTEESTVPLPTLTFPPPPPPLEAFSGKPPSQSINLAQDRISQGGKRMQQERRIRVLDYYKEYVKALESQRSEAEKAKKCRYKLKLNLLDTSQVLQNHLLVYLNPPASVVQTMRLKRSELAASSPDAIKFFSLVATPKSLLLFGGLAIDGQSVEDVVLNKLYMILSKPDSRLY